MLLPPYIKPKQANMEAVFNKSSLTVKSKSLLDIICLVVITSTVDAMLQNLLNLQ